jgi:hypothetical protein
MVPSETDQRVVMAGRDTDFGVNFAARDRVLCSVDASAADELTKAIFTKSGKLVVLHETPAQLMLLAPVHRPQRPIPQAHGHGASHMHSHHDEVRILSKNISRHCHELNAPDYFDIFPAAACYLLTEDHEEHYIIADSKGDHLKVISIEDWTLHRIIGNKGANDGEFTGISGVAVFSIHSEHYICVIEATLNRLQLLTHLGKPVASAGGSNGPKGGHLRGQFRNPVSVAAHFPSSRFYKSELFMGDFEPPWYLGVCGKEALEDELFAEHPRPGLFYVGRMSSDSDVFDLVFLNDTMKVSHRVIKRFISTTNSASHYSNVSGNNIRLFRLVNDASHAYRSILELIRSQHYLIKPREVRPYALVSVADRANNRIQIFKFYWISSDVYEPALECVAVIGGNRRETLALQAPVSVAYTPTGELVIVDGTNSNSYFNSYNNHRPTNMIHLVSPYPNLTVISTRAAPDYVKASHVIDIQEKVQRQHVAVQSLLASRPSTAADIGTMVDPSATLPALTSSEASISSAASVSVPVHASSAASFLPQIHTAIRADSPESMEPANIAGHSNAHGPAQGHSHGHHAIQPIDEMEVFEHKIVHAVEDAAHALDDDEAVGDRYELPELEQAPEPIIELAPKRALRKSGKASGKASTTSSKGGTSSKLSASMIAAVAAAHAADPIPTATWASFSQRGHLALSYSNGGVMVFEPYKFFQLGALMMFPRSILLQMLSYLTYEDAIELRNCCKYLHDLTRIERLAWTLWPLRRVALQHAIHVFLKYGRVYNGLSGLEAGLTLCDSRGEPLCKRHLELRYVISCLTFAFKYICSVFLSWFRCEGRGCTHSHAIAIIDKSVIEAIAAAVDSFEHEDIDSHQKSHQSYGCRGVYLERISLDVCVGQVFGPRYIWRIERFLEVLFERLSITVPLIKRQVLQCSHIYIGYTSIVG